MGANRRWVHDHFSHHFSPLALLLGPVHRLKMPGHFFVRLPFGMGMLHRMRAALLCERDAVEQGQCEWHDGINY